MLLWLPSQVDPPLFNKKREKRVGVAAGNFDVGDDEGEKGDKLRRRKRSRLRWLRYRNALLLVIGIIGCSIVFTSMSAHRTSRRGHDQQQKKKKENHVINPHHKHHDHGQGKKTRRQQHQLMEGTTNDEEREHHHYKVKELQLANFKTPSSAVNNKNKKKELPANSIYRLEMEDISGNLLSLGKFAGMVTLVVNTACLWGKTKLEYHELAILNENLERQGFQVLAFPTNDFQQELSSNAEIAQFWSTNYPEAKFPIFAQSSLHENPVYQTLQQHLPNKQHVKHNFFKYLVNQEGVAVQLFHKSQDPLSLKGPILHLLQNNYQADKEN